MGDAVSIPSLEFRTRPSARVWGEAVLRLLVYAVLLKGAEAALYYGLEVRDQAWEQTSNIRFSLSLNNALEWGNYANEKGYIEVYNALVAKWGDEGEYSGRDIGAPIQLDYTPLRLIIVAQWAKWAGWVRPESKLRMDSNVVAPRGNPRRANPWFPELYWFNAPMMWLNTACELSAAVGMFFLVRHWVRRSHMPVPADQSDVIRWLKRLGQWVGLLGAQRQLSAVELHLPRLSPYCGLFAGYISAMLLWFSPAVIWNAHCFPQWDVWLLPAYVWGIYLALRNWWLLAGVLLGIAAMAKGQIMMIMLALLLWPLLSLRLGALLRLASGVAAGAAIVLWPWLVSGPAAGPWLKRVAAGLALFLAVFVVRRWRRHWIASIPLVLGAAALIWPWTLHQYPDGPLLDWKITWGIGAGLVLLAVWALRFPAWSIPSGVAGALAGAGFLCMWVFGSSDAWYTIGFEYPTRHWKVLAWMRPSNLGAILGYGWNPGPGGIAPNPRGFGWGFKETFDLNQFIPWARGEWMVEVRSTMITCFTIGLVLCAIAMAWHARRQDRRFLYAIVAPWVLMFALMPQMQDRYLVWGAAMSAAVAGLSLSGSLLYLTLTLANWAMMAFCMLTGPDGVAGRLTPEGRQWSQRLAPIFPDMGWAMVLVAMICLNLALSRSRRARRKLAAPPVAVPPAAVSPAEQCLALEEGRSGRLAHAAAAPAC